MYVIKRQRLLERFKMQLYAVLQGMHLNPNDIEKFNIKGQESSFTQMQTEKTKQQTLNKTKGTI